MITFSNLGYLGRLGNQMFQFASTLGISDRLGLEARFPLENTVFEAPTGPYDPNLGKNTLNKCELLECFSIDPNFFIPRGHLKVERRFSEATFTYDIGTARIQDGTDLFGYFQTEKYFLHCEGLIRTNFAFKEEIVKRAGEILGGIKAQHGERPLVSLHVRRGDYVRFPDHHPVCSPEYYRLAVSEMQASGQGLPLLLVFSDDLDWCRANFQGESFELQSSGSDFVDLCLMSLCDHHIIANSSFSWWGAWLNPDQNKKVVAPRKWFGPAMNKNVEDVYCRGWIKI